MVPTGEGRRKSGAFLSVARMSPDSVVIRSVSPEDTAQVGFTEHDEMVERFATYRSDEALDVAVLQRRAWRGRVISDSHCTNAAGIRWTEGSVTVANQVKRRFVPGKGVKSPDLRSNWRSDCSSR
jgi:hypothetical protein